MLERNILNTEISWAHSGNVLIGTLFLATATKLQLFTTKLMSFPGTFKKPNFSSFGDRQFMDDDSQGFSEIIFDSKNSVLFHSYYRESSGITLWLAGPSFEEIDKKISDIGKLLEKIPTDSNKLEFIFWYYSSLHRSPVTRIRSIAVPTWADISQNYHADAYKNLDTLMGSRPTLDDGKILLWNGEAGTGKTYAIRTLANAWKDWCSFEYIIDPESLFSNSDYMIETVLRSDSATKKWKCIVLEDCGEMIAMDSKTKVGQALSRLLNLADGVLGQGLEVMFLITTNEELGKLHPAVSRLGRCFSKIEFGKLSPEECEKWLFLHEVRASIKESNTLSDLYGVLRKSVTKGHLKIGFQPNKNLVLGPQLI